MQSKRSDKTNRPRLQLSATQIIASALAAVTATIAASYLGINGTVIGAAIASVLTVTGNAVYSHSIHRTRERVRIAAPANGRRTRPTPSDDGTPDTGQYDAPTAVTPALGPRPNRSSTWRRIGFATVGLFVTVLTVLTSAELLAGRPISDVLRGRSASGTTVFGTSQHSSQQPQPQVTVTETIVPKIVLVTPTVTRTAPAVTVTPTSSPSATPGSPAPSATAPSAAAPTSTVTTP